MAELAQEWTHVTRKDVPPELRADGRVRTMLRRLIVSLTFVQRSSAMPAREPPIVAWAFAKVTVVKRGIAIGTHVFGQSVAGASTIQSALCRGAPGARTERLNRSPARRSLSDIVK